ncbi:hypothetical protein OE88DRAFT_1029284 [Heliocybe sulcata]|uniref:Uncharacterized protein n=1 Tax=Heliocybe sulcata TaxID=5364 RepID=A0A5C3NEH0_9AGAM|nr:hypothetical protein OE88DRAFT_1029284 [Heliocybe sulcata]
MRRKSKSNGMPKLKPLRAGTELRREKPQGGVPGPVDPYMVVPRRLSDSLIAPTRPPTTPPPTYHPSSRKSIHDPASYAFSGRTTADAHAASPRSSLRFSAVGLGFCETVPLPSPALTTDQSFLNFASELRETSTPRRDSVDRRSSASPGASPKSASGNGQKKEGWVMIETV